VGRHQVDEKKERLRFVAVTQPRRDAFFCGGWLGVGSLLAPSLFEVVEASREPPSFDDVRIFGEPRRIMSPTE
jgi:hypothetical protein